MKRVLLVGGICFVLTVTAVLIATAMTGRPLYLHGRPWGIVSPDFAKLKVSMFKVNFRSDRSPGNIVKEPSTWSNRYFTFHKSGGRLRHKLDFSGPVHEVWWVPRTGHEAIAAKWGRIEPRIKGNNYTLYAPTPAVEPIEAYVFVLHE